MPTTTKTPADLHKEGVAAALTDLVNDLSNLVPANTALAPETQEQIVDGTNFTGAQVRGLIRDIAARYGVTGF